MVSGVGGAGFEPPARVMNNGTYGTATLIPNVDRAGTIKELDLKLYKEKFDEKPSISRKIASFLNNEEIV